MATPSRPPAWMDPKPAPVRKFTTVCLALAAIFVVGYLLTRGNPNAGLFLLVAAVFAGLSLVALLVAGVQRWGGSALSRTGYSERDLLIAGLLVVAIATPWSVEVVMAGARQVFGWQSPVAWLVAAGTFASVVRRWPRFRGPALAVSGLALLGWVVWLSLQLLRPNFSSLQFTFLPGDLVGEGWYIATLAWVIALDAVAARSADEDAPARGRDLWVLGLVPGAALTRLGYKTRGRLWLGAAAFVVFLIFAAAIDPLEFQDYGAHNGMPPPRPRGSGVAIFILLAIVWATSLVDTWRKARAASLAV